MLQGVFHEGMVLDCWLSHGLAVNYFGLQHHALQLPFRRRCERVRFKKYFTMLVDVFLNFNDLYARINTCNSHTFHARTSVLVLRKFRNPQLSSGSLSELSRSWRILLPGMV